MKEGANEISLNKSETTHHIMTKLLDWKKGSGKLLGTTLFEGFSMLCFVILGSDIFYKNEDFEGKIADKIKLIAGTLDTKEGKALIEKFNTNPSLGEALNKAMKEKFDISLGNDGETDINFLKTFNSCF